MSQYFLMHKDTVCGTIMFDDRTGQITGYRDHHTGFSPYMGNADLEKMIQWWGMRAVPASRTAIQEVLRRSGCLNTSLYLAKNLALSMTDTYWVCPSDANLKYDQVKFLNLVDYNEGKIPYHNATSYDYNASLGGQMEKYWDLDQPVPVLVKESIKYYGQQSVNEIFATHIHTLQDSGIPFVRYSAEAVEGYGIISRCNAFTSNRVELISAYELVESQKAPNSCSLYDHYINLCAHCGISRDAIQEFMDYQTMTDFIISNTDEHLANFGVLRDADTMRLIGPAPIFDSGNSMFFNDNRTIPYSRAGLLERPITSFYKTEDRLLAKVRNRKIVRPDLLPSPAEVKDFYVRARIPEPKAEFISRNYETKLQMIREFQQGKTISLYQEKQAEKQKRAVAARKGHATQKFIMLCGLPGSGKTEKAAQLMLDYQRAGRIPQGAERLFTVSDAIRAASFILDKKQAIYSLPKTPGYEQAVTLVSANIIREELAKQGIPLDNNLVFLIAQARTRAALISGATVIYDASNISGNTRKDFLEIAKNAGIRDTEIHIMDMQAKEQIPGISQKWMEILKGRLLESYPSIGEGWNRIVDDNRDRGQNMERYLNTPQEQGEDDIEK